MKVIVVGGGWSGLAAAVRLREQGHDVHLVEAAKHLGGRARTVQWREINVDNGQHLMIGAYQRTLALFDTIGLPTDALIKRVPLNIQILDKRYPPLKLYSPHHPLWPLSSLWHVLSKNDLSLFWPLLKFSWTSLKITANNDHSVADLLKQARQPKRLVDQLWEPLCLAMLNTPIVEASAFCFVTVLKKTFAKANHPDLLIPQTSLGELLPEYAKKWLTDHEATISLQTKVTDLVINANTVVGIETDDEVLHADHVVIATAPTAAISLLTPHISIPDLGSHPITTVYLQYDTLPTVDWAMLGLSGTIAQWIFTRHDCAPNLVSVVISGPGKHEKMDKHTLINSIAEELHIHIKDWPKTVREGFVIREKRATFSATVNMHLQRPQPTLTLKGVSLAGDLAENGYPATIEGAIINGENVANNLQRIPRTAA
jgi:squalene-associated FAD-dependent desaturase